MSNYDGIDHLSPGDEPLLAHDARREQDRRNGTPQQDRPYCWGCPNGCDTERCGIRLCVRGCDEERSDGPYCARCGNDRNGEAA